MKVASLQFVNAAPLHPRRSFILGCGGMGVEVANHVKHVLAQRLGHRPEYPVRVLCFDSAAPETLTARLVLDQNKELVRVYCEDLRERLTNLGAYPQVNAWFPAAAREVAVSIASQLPDAKEGAASTRPFGRIGFYDKWSDVYDRLRRLVHEEPATAIEVDGATSAVEDDGCHFYVVASVGGGTGTGIFLDVAAMVRKLEKDLGLSGSRVYAILILPELLARDAQIDRKYAPQIMANGYAALKELDHYQHGEPFRARYGAGQDEAVAIPSLFDAVFLVDAENNAGKALTSRAEMATFCGEMLFHLTMTEAGRNFERRLPDVQARQYFTTELPEVSDREQRRGIVRERRRCLYCSFGHATVEIPVARILGYCVAQHALEVLEFAAEPRGDAPEEIAERVRELMAGSPANPPLMEQLGLTPEGLTRRLNVSRSLPPLPGAGQFLAARSAAAALQTLLGNEAWTDERAAEWRRRARDAAEEFRRGLMEQSNNVGPDGLSQVLPGKIQALCNTILAADGAAVLDHLLDQVEEQLVVLRSDAEEELQSLAKDLAIEQEGGANNRYWRTLRSAVQDVEEDESHAWGEGIRSWRNRRSIGPIVEDMLPQLQKLRERYLRVPVLEERIHLCNALIEEINRQDDVILPQRAGGLQQVRQQLKEGRDRAIAACRGDDGAHRHIAPRLDEFYRNEYLPRLGGGRHPQTMAANLRKDGLILAGGATLPFPEWGDAVPAVVAALQRVCREPTELAPTDALPRPGSGSGGSKDLWSLSFDWPFFRDTLDSPDDFDAIATELRTWSEPYLEYDGGGVPDLHWRQLISGSCLGQRGRRWSTWLSLSGLGREPLPGLPNKVTLLTINMAIPLFRLARIREWKRHYDAMLQKGWPLHLFQDAAEWNEPYISMEPLPDINAEELLKEGLARGVVKSDGSGLYRYEHPRLEIKSLFHDAAGRERWLEQAAMKAELARNAILIQEILEDIVEKILEEDGADLEEKLKAGEYPAFLRPMLLDYLGLPEALTTEQASR